MSSSSNREFLSLLNRESIYFYNDVVEVVTFLRSCLCLCAF